MACPSHLENIRRLQGLLATTDMGKVHEHKAVTSIGDVDLCVHSPHKLASKFNEGDRLKRMSMILTWTQRWPLPFSFSSTKTIFYGSAMRKCFPNPFETGWWQN